MSVDLVSREVWLVYQKNAVHFPSKKKNIYSTAVSSVLHQAYYLIGS